MRIIRHQVDSSSIVSIGYAADAATLEVQFRSGAVYWYFGVPPSTYEKLGTAESVGRYFNANIRTCFGYARQHDQGTSSLTAQGN